MQSFGNIDQEIEAQLQASNLRAMRNMRATEKSCRKHSIQKLLVGFDTRKEIISEKKTDEMKLNWEQYTERDVSWCCDP